MPLRERLADALKDAMKARDARRVSTLRLVLAAVKDRDIAGRTEGAPSGVGEDELLQVMAKMIKQREESAGTYAAAGRADLAEAEREEIAVIREFMPRQLSPEETRQAAADAVRDLGAAGMKDMGRVMAGLRARYAGQMDFAVAGAAVKELLSAK